MFAPFVTFVIYTCNKYECCFTRKWKWVLLWAMKEMKLKSLLKYLCLVGIKCCYWNETFYINSLNLVWQFHISQGLYNRVIISYLSTRRSKMLHATCICLKISVSQIVEAFLWIIRLSLWTNISVKKNVDCRYILSVQYITSEQSLLNKKKPRHQSCHDNN